jgi:hypothetical protein
MTLKVIINPHWLMTQCSKASGLIGTEEPFLGFLAAAGRATLGNAHWYHDRGHGLG